MNTAHWLRNIYLGGSLHFSVPTETASKHLHGRHGVGVAPLPSHMHEIPVAILSDSNVLRELHIDVKWVDKPLMIKYR